MPAFNFQSQWANAVEIGARYANNGDGILANGICTTFHKRTTIRKAGRAKPGDTLYLYTGQRTKACRKLGEVLCLAVTPIRRPTDGAPVLILGTQWLFNDALERFARLDTAGLWNAETLLAFFDKTYAPDEELALYCW
jgi:hypothetical protein